MSAFLAVGAGAVLGAWLRWGLAAWLNPMFPSLPLGTLAANAAKRRITRLLVTWIAVWTTRAAT